MKKNTYIALGLFLVFSLTAMSQSGENYFYYYKENKIPLALNTEYVYLLMKSGVTSEAQLKITLGQYVEITKFSRSDVAQTLRTENSTATQDSEYWAEVKLSSKLPYTDQVNQLKDNPSIALVAPYFKNETKDKIGLSNYFYVKLRNERDLTLLLETAKSTQTEIVGQNIFMPLWYTLKCTGNSYYNALEAANFFHESGRFAAAEPDLMIDDLLSYTDNEITTASGNDETPYLIPNDPLYANQWGLNNTGQSGGTAGVDIKAEDAWDITTGNPNIVVAVLDHGFEMNHPDLQNNVFGQGYDAQTGSAPSIVRGNHGTACAGIIGAVQNNNLGVSGVAPNTRISSISVSFGFTTTIQMLADGVNWAVQNGADIISNSWGGGTPSNIFDNAIDNAINNGRGGLGTIIVFSSGNNNSATSNYPGNSNPAIINVGAVDRCGIRSGRIDIIPQSCDPWCAACQPASAFGTTLDVVAPGTSVPTTDRQGGAGYVNGDYRIDFGGTSAACPYVAGVAALVLSVNPNLTVQEVNDIIEQSAQKVGGYTYQNTAGRPNGTWDNEVGYGLVDAHAAVLLAQDCQENLLVNQDVSGGTTDNKEAEQTITATNTIANNGTATYHAGIQVTLQPGFHAQSGAEFHAYIEGCSGMFQAKMQGQNIKTQEQIPYTVPENEQAVDLTSAEAINDNEFVVYPNPFTDVINFKYTVKEENSPVQLKIYSPAGREITTLVQEQQVAADTYHVQFNGSGLPEGVYLYRLEIGQTVKTGKIVLKK